MSFSAVNLSLAALDFLLRRSGFLLCSLSQTGPTEPAVFFNLRPHMAQYLATGILPQTETFNLRLEAIQRVHETLSDLFILLSPNQMQPDIHEFFDHSVTNIQFALQSLLSQENLQAELPDLAHDICFLARVDVGAAGNVEQLHLQRRVLSFEHLVPAGFVVNEVSETLAILPKEDFPLLGFVVVINVIPDVLVSHVGKRRVQHTQFIEILLDHSEAAARFLPLQLRVETVGVIAELAVLPDNQIVFVELGDLFEESFIVALNGREADKLSLLNRLEV